MRKMETRNLLLFLVVVLLKLWIAESVDTKFAPVVETTKGPVRGSVFTTVKQYQQYFAYKNIRYAKPPVGHLRFQPPVEADPWTEVFDATKDNPGCPQVENGTMIGQADCLSVNVYTSKIPEKDSNDELRPVMFWIYGGSFVTGYNKQASSSPDYLIEEGVVVVTVNYRLGPLGFLALGHPNVTGNAGLKDQNLALRWVRDNIEKFGGDSKKVTIFGQSAGGASVAFQMLSESSKGLFHGAISMSGSSVAIWALHRPKDALAKGFELARRLGSTAKTVESLAQFFYEVDIKSLIEMTSNLTLVDVPFKPTIENSNVAPKEKLFLTECPIRKYKSGNYNHVPHMLGYMKDEVLLFSSTLEDFKNIGDYALKGMKILGLQNSLTDLLDPIKSITKNFTDTGLLTDFLFVAPIDYTQRLLSKSNSPIYMYKYSFDYENSLHKIISNVKRNGSAHSDEIPMLFYSDNFQIDPNSNDTRELVQRRMTRLWTNFAKFGNPTPEGTKDTLLDVVWPDSRADGKMLEITENLVATERQITPRLKRIEAAIEILGPHFTGCKK